MAWAVNSVRLSPKTNACLTVDSEAVTGWVPNQSAYDYALLFTVG